MMQKYLRRLPEELQDLISLSRQIAYANNMSAYLVGGFVRDLFLGVKNLDLDIVVEGDGIAFAEDLIDKLKSKIVKHSRFRTATIFLEPNHKIDIATARKEYYPEPAQLPVVSHGLLKDDLKRRDFTINAMAISITGEDFGRLIDFYNGKRDLHNKKICVLHKVSFIDDPTRILRAIRFEKRYNFRIEPKTLDYLKKAVSLGMIDKVQPHRLRDELILLLREQNPLKALRRLQQLVGFGFISQDLRFSKKKLSLFSCIQRNIHWYIKTYSRRRQLDSWLIYFMGMIDSLKMNEVKSICKKYAFRKGETRRIIAFKKINNSFIQRLSQSKLSSSKIFHLLEPLSYEAIIFIKAKYKNVNLQRRIEDFFEIYNGMRILISGDDLGRLGIVPGPYYQKIFAKVLKAKLEGRVGTKEEELNLIKKMITKK